MGLWANRSIASIVRTMLDVTRLRVLVAVARHGSVTAAARALNYAQPSVSHHLARLEAETGTKLVQRAGRGLRLPDAGRPLGERAGWWDAAAPGKTSSRSSPGCAPGGCGWPLSPLRSARSCRPPPRSCKS